MYECMDCGNNDLFISEVSVWHWCKVDSDGVVVSIDGIQGEEIEIDNTAYLECQLCNSTNVVDTVEDVWRDPEAEAERRYFDMHDDAYIRDLRGDNMDMEYEREYMYDDQA